MSRSHAGRIAALACLLGGAAAGGLACGGGLPLFHAADTDGAPEQAVAVALGAPVAGALHCGKGGGPDCADWYRLRPQRPGELAIAVSAERPDGTPAPVSLTLADETGQPLGDAEGSGEPGARIARRVDEPVAFLAAVRTPPGTGEVKYVLQPAMDDGTRAVATRKERFTVLEVESREGEVSVLIDGGLAQGMRAGYRGRLLEGDRPIGRIEVLEVFEQGSRVRVEGPLAAPVTPATVAEIEVPSR